MADVRIRDGLIAEIGAGLVAGPRERVVDATGCYVTPGFIETHNHFDAPMWWMPTLEPMRLWRHHLDQRQLRFSPPGSDESRGAAGG